MVLALGLANQARRYAVQPVRHNLLGVSMLPGLIVLRLGVRLFRFDLSRDIRIRSATIVLMFENVRAARREIILLLRRRRLAFCALGIFSARLVGELFFLGERFLCG